MTAASPQRPAKGFAFMGVSVVTTTVPTVEDAQRLAGGAVQAQLAACAQVDEIRSHYLWQGKVQDEPEWRLAFKTVPDAVQPLVEWLRSQHPYELPQIMMRGEQAQPDYAAWVAQSVRVPKAGHGVAPHALNGHVDGLVATLPAETPVPSVPRAA